MGKGFNLAGNGQSHTVSLGCVLLLTPDGERSPGERQAFQYHHPTGHVGLEHFLQRTAVSLSPNVASRVTFLPSPVLRQGWRRLELCMDGVCVEPAWELTQKLSELLDLPSSSSSSTSGLQLGFPLAVRCIQLAAKHSSCIYCSMQANRSVYLL